MSTGAGTVIYDALHHLVEELADVQAQRADLGQREDTLKTAIRAIASMGSTRVGAITLSVVQARKLDVDLAERTYPATDYPELWVVSLDGKRLRAHVSPDAYSDLLTNNGDLRVSLR